MRLLTVFCTYFFFCSVKLFATAQTPDYLLIGKDTLRLHSNPLQEYFEKNPFPDDLITERNTGNWRGYIAYFKFVDNKLVVENIYKEESRKNAKGYHDHFLTSIYKAVFGDNLNFECSYYSGLLVCPYGEIVHYVHMGYASVFENYKLFEISNGLNVKSKDITGGEFQNFKINYYRYYKTTEEYKLKAAEFKKMLLETNEDVERSFEQLEGKKKNKKKENTYLKQKEAEYKANKELDNFLFVFMDDYIKTIEIPNK